MGLPVDEAVDHLHPGALERAGPQQILLLVEAGLELDHRGDRLAGFGGVDQRADDRRLLAGAVQRLLDRDDVGVGRRLLEEFDHHLEAFVGVVDEDVLAPDRREAIAAMLADALGEARVEGPELEVGAVFLDQAGEVGHAEEAARLGDDRVRRVEAVLDHPHQAFGHARLELQPDHPAAAAALDRGAEVADQILGFLLDLDVAVAQDPERAAAQHVVAWGTDSRSCAGSAFPAQCSAAARRGCG